MKFSPPESWSLTIQPKGYRIEGTRSFSGKCCSRDPKLYVFCDRGNVVYVGICRRPISSRLRDGFTAKGKGGYHGYAFRRPEAIREHGGTLTLRIWTHEDPVPEKRGRRNVVNKDGTKRWSLLDVEKVEAELVFLIRQHTGNWPRYQTEIHFSQPLDRHQAAAEEIFRQLRSGELLT